MVKAASRDTNAGENATERGPVLLFGMARSGTTWVGKLFDSHRNTLYRHEPDTVQRLNDILAICPDRGAVPPEALARLRLYAQTLAQRNEPRVCTKMPVFPKAYMSPAHFRGFQANITLNKFAERAGINIPVMNTGGAASRAGAVVVWKSIESLGRLGVLLDAIPGARAVHLVRHPCGSIASVRRGEAGGSFTSATPASEDWHFYDCLLDTAQARKYGLTKAQLVECSPLERMAWSWVIINEKAMTECAPDPRYLLMRYEDICEDPLTQTRRMFMHCGLSVDTQAEAFITRSVTGRSGNYYSVFKDPTESADKWRHELSAADARAVAAVVEHTAPGRLFA